MEIDFTALNQLWEEKETESCDRQPERRKEMSSEERVIKYVLDNLNKVLSDGNIVSLRMFVIELQTLQKVLGGVQPYMKSDVLNIFCKGEETEDAQ